MSFWFDMIGIILLIFGLGIAIISYTHPLFTFGKLMFLTTEVALLFTGIGITLVIINYFIHRKNVNKEEQNIEQTIGHDRMHLFYYSALFLGLLIFAASIFIYSKFTELTSPTFTINWIERVMIAIWFAMLGTVTVSFKGLSDHSKDWNTYQWGLWYIERPLNGFIIGVMTFIILQILNTNAPPSIPTLAAVSFILGLQENKFFQILERIAKVILGSKQIDDKN